MSQKNTSPNDGFSLEATFVLLSDTSLRLDSDLQSPVIRRFLAAQILRDPHDLRHHVRRVWLAVDADDSYRLFGALIDVFLALGPRAPKLRAALLGLASPHLDQEDLAFFRTHLDHGLRFHDPIPAGSASVLDRGLIGQREIVRKERAHDTERNDPLKNAIAFLNDGQIAAARELLESALLLDPSNQPIELELLEIYRRTRDTSALHSMRDRMLGMGIELSPAWSRH